MVSRVKLKFFQIHFFCFCKRLDQISLHLACRQNEGVGSLLKQMRQTAWFHVGVGVRGRPCHDYDRERNETSSAPEPSRATSSEPIRPPYDDDATSPVMPSQSMSSRSMIRSARRVCFLKMTTLPNPNRSVPHNSSLLSE